MRGGDDNSIENCMEVKKLEMETEVKQLESCDRTLKAGSIVTCEKYPGKF
jgi:hypothetical protein